MKPILMKRSGLLLATAMMAALAWLVATGGAALAQTAGGGTQTEETPLWKSALMGSSAPLIDVSENPGWMQGLSVSGFINNITGMWVDSSGIRYQKNKNSLATERNWLQLDINYILNGDNRFFVRGWVVYEPPYRFEYASGLNDMSDYYNQWNVRDAYWKSVNGPLTLFVGRQIVTWGESLAFRVGDVINPQDFTWNFGFSNLEQSRLPLWMVHPIMNLPSWGPLTANFVEGIWTPVWQPMYNPSVDTPNQSSNPHSNWYDGQHDVAGSVSLLAPFTSVASARFQTQPAPILVGGPGIPNNMAAFPQLCGQFVGRHCMVSGFNNFSSPFFGYRLPADNLGSSTEGFRIHTLVKNAEITLIYWHGHQFNEAGTPGAQFYVIGNPGGPQFLQTSFPQFNDIGATLNRPIYLPGEILSSVPIVLRTEAIFQDRTPFNTTDVGVHNAVVDKSTVNSLVALDLDGLYAPWLTTPAR